jgi:hypothetical protein
MEAALCIVCEHMLYEEHCAAEHGRFDPCQRCCKFPSNEGKRCYHCFSVGQIVDECPECESKPWSEDFLAVKAEIETDLEKGPRTIH